MVSRRKLRRDPWGPDPRPADIEGPEAPKTSPARKDTRNWCKGKVGRDHVFETVVPENANHFTRKEPCFLGKSYAPRVPEPRWFCSHVIRCSVCGKVFERFLGERCPDYPKAGQ